MRIRALLLLLGLTGYQAAAQQLSGTYETRKDRGVISFEYEQMRFNGVHFYYLLDSCTGITTGYGTFRLVGDSLTLHFEDSTAAMVKVVPTPCLVPGYCCTVLDAATRQPIVGATVVLQRHWPGKLLGAATDDEGRVAFSNSVRPPSPQPDSCLTISAIGHQSLIITLPAGVPQGFTTYLLPSNSIPANTVYRYKLYPSPANQLLLNNRPYQKLTAQRQRELARRQAKQEKQLKKELEARGL